MEQKMSDHLIDYSQHDFAIWNMEREKHLQTIEHLKQRIAELTAEKDMWMKEATRPVVHYHDPA